MNLRRAATLIAAAVCAAVTATACATTVTGAARPASGLRPGTDVFVGMDACRVLDQLLAGQGFSPGEKERSTNGCTASKYGFGSYALVLDPVQGLEVFRTRYPGTSEISINDRRGLYFYDPRFQFCALALEVTEQSRVLVLASAIKSGQDQACQNAQGVARRLEPLLPTPP
ncbi:DUF3558 domain-containing protein [Amycolatopsis granulosa]|uniref:DUF3558 domain-containing protein n=1 Tax=Amycolatopsis granulosa TaxID=185684 RepID=UPI001FBA4639|nr:DUF3558 domain-containing protein [Amycolatopsis granulosa]NIH84439.1 hypothetical protein [Amycolatopsis granulosa]